MLDQEQMLKDFLNSKKFQGENKPKAASRIMCVTSGKGGVGKSNFTVNFALELAKANKRVLIIDADFGLSNIDVILGVTPKYDLSYVMRRKKHLREIITAAPGNINFISGGSGVYDLINLSADDIEYFLAELSDIENDTDIIIFDTGAGINDNNVQIITACDEVVLVATTEPPSIVDAYALLKTVIDVRREPEFKLVINKAENVNEARRIIGNFINVTKSYLRLNIEPLGYILDDSSVVKAVKSQKPFVTMFPDSAAAKNMSGIAAKYLTGCEEQEKETKEGGLKSFFRRFMRK